MGGLNCAGIGLVNGFVSGFRSFGYINFLFPEVSIEYPIKFIIRVTIVHETLFQILD